jgi:hypothetical protein
MDRTAFFRREVTRSMRGIEIGRFYGILCPRCQRRIVLVVDH